MSEKPKTRRGESAPPVAKKSLETFIVRDNYNIPAPRKVSSCCKIQTFDIEENRKKVIRCCGCRKRCEILTIPNSIIPLLKQDIEVFATDLDVKALHALYALLDEIRKTHHETIIATATVHPDGSRDVSLTMEFKAKILAAAQLGPDVEPLGDVVLMSENPQALHTYHPGSTGVPPAMVRIPVHRRPPSIGPRKKVENRK